MMYKLNKAGDVLFDPDDYITFRIIDDFKDFEHLFLSFLFSLPISSIDNVVTTSVIDKKPVKHLVVVHFSNIKHKLILVDNLRTDEIRVGTYGGTLPIQFYRYNKHNEFYELRTVYHPRPMKRFPIENEVRAFSYIYTKNPIDYIRLVLNDLILKNFVANKTMMTISNYEEYTFPYQYYLMFDADMNYFLSIKSHSNNENFHKVSGPIPDFIFNFNHSYE